LRVRFLAGYTIDTHESSFQKRQGFTAQATQALANLKAVLEAAGSGFEHCLKATCFILDVDKNLPLLNEVWVRHFGKNLPARTVVGVAKLRENYLLEIEATAYVP
jgi:2-iminobutanoate/2-iminopropanoate deaminase